MNREYRILNKVYLVNIIKVRWNIRLLMIYNYQRIKEEYVIPNKIKKKVKKQSFNRVKEIQEVIFKNHLRIMEMNTNRNKKS